MLHKSSTPLNINKRERVGWYFYDWAISAFSATVVTVFLGPYLTTICETAAANDPNGYIYLLGIPIYYGSYFAYIVSFSVLLQVFILPIIGTFADAAGKKKSVLITSAYIGVTATISMYFLEGGNYILGGALFVVANLSFGVSMVVYNAYLNDIAKEDERDSVSSIGWAFGYLGGGILLALNLALFSQAESFGISTGEAVRICLASAGVWWGIFTIFPMVWLRIHKNKSSHPRKINLSQSFRQLFISFNNLRKYPHAFYFLIAYLLFNDGVQSVITLAAQFGQEELGLKMATLTQVILIVQFVAFGGALLFNFIAKAIGSKKALLWSLVLWSGTLYYAFGFLNSEIGFYFLGAVIGLIMGGTQALSRSLFSLLIPNGREAEYFGLYEVSERGTSWTGPLVFGLSLQFTGSYRIAILSLIIFFVAGFALLLRVNVRKGIEEANG